MPITTWLRFVQHHPETMLVEDLESAWFSVTTPEDALWATLVLGVQVTAAHGPTLAWDAWAPLWAWVIRTGGWQTAFLWTALLNASCLDGPASTGSAPVH
jgi:hypothetical protein